MAMSIGELARHAGCSVPTVRFYESAGLIPRAARASNGRRTYGQPDVDRLTFVRRAREFGLSIEQVRRLLVIEAGSDPDCRPAKAILAQHLGDVRKKRGELAQLEKSLARMLDRCGGTCFGSEEPCTIFADIQTGRQPVARC